MNKKELLHVLRKHIIEQVIKYPHLRIVGNGNKMYDFDLYAEYAYNCMSNMKIKLTYDNVWIDGYPMDHEGILTLPYYMVAGRYAENLAAMSSERKCEREAEMTNTLSEIFKDKGFM